jgi:hypothetical protein
MPKWLEYIAVAGIVLGSIVALACIAQFMTTTIVCDLTAFASACLMMPLIVLHWIQAISLSLFLNRFMLPLAALVLFIFIVVKLKAPEK